MANSIATRPSELLRKLADVVGPAHVLNREEDITPYVTDRRQLYGAPAECVVRPANTREVAQVVGLCAGERVAIVPQGGNTSLSGGSVPTGQGREIVLSLGRMNRIRNLDASNNTMTVEAGCILANVQDAARQADRLFPISLAAEGSCQIGGNLSTNAGGVNVLRYGNTREQVLGIEVVLPDGSIWDGLRALRKDNTGYDLKQLFLGAEGTLGIITAAVLRLRPRPTATLTAWAGLATPRDAVSWLDELKARLAERIDAYELISRPCLDAVLTHNGAIRDPLSRRCDWYVLVELADSGPQEQLRSAAESAFAPGLERGTILDLALAESGVQASALWRIREAIPEAQFRNVKHDVSVPVSAVPDLIAQAGRALEAAFPGIQVYAFGHVGDGNIHYNVAMGDPAQTGVLMQQRERVNGIVFEVVARLGGSISAEHGLGQLKRDAIRRFKPEVELRLMRTLKKALDPEGIMNPGKVL